MEVSPKSKSPGTLLSNRDSGLERPYLSLFTPQRRRIIATCQYRLCIPLPTSRDQRTLSIEMVACTLPSTASSLTAVWPSCSVAFPITLSLNQSVARMRTCDCICFDLSGETVEEIGHMISSQFCQPGPMLAFGATICFQDRTLIPRSGASQGRADATRHRRWPGPVKESGKLDSALSTTMTTIFFPLIG